MPELNPGSGLHLELVGVIHHGDLLLGVILSESRATGSQAHQRFLRFGESALLDQPPPDERLTRLSDPLEGLTTYGKRLTYGLSGAKAIPSPIGKTQTHWMAKGIL